MILFIHVSKTAGTSFRGALEKEYRKKKIALDYGRESAQTSDIVRQHLYAGKRQQPRKTLLQALGENDCAVLAGHFPYRKYGWFFRPVEIVTIIRDPLHRLASEYLHRRRLQGYQESFTTFIETPGHQNTQSNLLDGLPPRAFVCITERYVDSLQLLGKHLGTAFTISRSNVAPDGGATEFVTALSAQVKRRMEKLNEQDLALYEHRLNVLDWNYQEQFPAHA